jgi:hypothetical protein
MIAGPSGQAEPRARASAGARVITSAEAQEPRSWRRPSFSILSDPCPSTVPLQPQYHLVLLVTNFLFDKSASSSGFRIAARLLRVGVCWPHRLIQKRTID